MNQSLEIPAYTLTRIGASAITTRRDCTIVAFVADNTRGPQAVVRWSDASLGSVDVNRLCQVVETSGGVA